MKIVIPNVRNESARLVEKQVKPRLFCKKNNNLSFRAFLMKK